MACSGAPPPFYLCISSSASLRLCVQRPPALCNPLHRQAKAVATMKPDYRHAVVACRLALMFTAAVRAAPAPDAGQVVVSGPASPRVAYGVARGRRRADCSPSPSARSRRKGATRRCRSACAADKTRAPDEQGRPRHARRPVGPLRVPRAGASPSLTATRDGRLRAGPRGELGRAARSGNPVRRESFLQNGTAPSTRGLSPDPQDWQPISLAEFERAARDRALEIAFDVRATYCRQIDGGDRRRARAAGAEPRLGRPRRKRGRGGSSGTAATTTAKSCRRASTAGGASPTRA